MSNLQKELIRIVAVIVATAVATVLSLLGFTSCNVVRTITNESQYVQKGDTSVVIHTKTIESYDASKK